MGLEMVNRNERTVMQGGEGPPRQGTNHQRPHQARCHRGRHSIQLRNRRGGLIQNLIDQVGQCFHMPTRGDLWNDTTPLGMLINLGCDAMGAQLFASDRPAGSPGPM